jgi:NitT/TauT family transport system substrate-binding protein
VAGRRLTVVEPFRSLFYTPQFVALHRGEFAAEGFEVVVRTATGSGGTIPALLDGEAEVAMGGIMRSLDLADRGGPFVPHFVEVNRLNGFFLLARKPWPGFRWADLEGRAVISFAGAPTPYFCMLAVLRRSGVDAARVRFVRDLHGDDAVRAFRAGEAEFLEAGQPTAEALIAGGAGHLVASMGEATGPVPFSSYMTRADRLRSDPELFTAFTRAVLRAQAWMARATATEIAEVVAPAFPDVPGPLRTAVVDRYVRQGTWATAGPIERESYDALHAILLDGGFIRSAHRYEDLVDTAIVRRALASLGPAPP